MLTRVLQRTSRVLPSPNTRAVQRHGRFMASITRPYRLRCDGARRLDPRFERLPTEYDVARPFMARDTPYGEDMDYLTPTGISLADLAYLAGQILSIDELPEIEMGHLGSCNTVFLLKYRRTGLTVSARLPLKHSRDAIRVEGAVAAMSYARHVLGMADVVPEVFAWDSTSDNLLRAPYTLQQYIPSDFVEAWSVMSGPLERRRTILHELAKWHAALSQPLAPHLNGVGELRFAPGATDPVDALSYVVGPLSLRGRGRWYDPIPVGTFHATTTSLPTLWDELWNNETALARSNLGHALERDPADFAEEGLDQSAFARVADRVRLLAQQALEIARAHPEHMQPTLVNRDYAFRNVLVDPRTGSVSALIDWDDVFVLPFVVSVDYPLDLLESSTSALNILPADSDFIREGRYRSFPHNQYGDIVEVHEGQPGSERRDAWNSLVYETELRDQYLSALCAFDPRFSDAGVWQTRKSILKAHHILTSGAETWWNNRDWLKTTSF